MRNPILLVGGIVAVGVFASGAIILQKPTSPEMGVPTFGYSEKRYAEIADPAGFLNAEPFTLGELVGKKVILVDFMTYSCINCIRTFPYLNAWYEKYRDEGLEIVGIHTPEFVFEKDIENVRDAMREHGITYPIVLDNDYATWRAYGNNYWPRKYLIDIEGNIVYDHIGEGAYEETEQKIQELLRERAEMLNGRFEDTTLSAAAIPEEKRGKRTPEIYFGAERNDRLGMGIPYKAGIQTFSMPEQHIPDVLYLDGVWNMSHEYAEPRDRGRVRIHYRGRDVFLVAAGETEGLIEVWQDGVRVGRMAGEDVKEGSVKIDNERLYKIIHNPEHGEHVLELFVPEGIHLFTLTFG